MNRNTYIIDIFKTDNRYKAGKRKLNSYRYSEVHDRWMEEEMQYLQHYLYKSKDGFSIVCSKVTPVQNPGEN